MGSPGQIELNEQFRKSLDLLEKSKRNVFITGKAGTGKSTLLDHFRNIAHKHLVVLAPTGVAAVNIQGETIHSFFKFQPGVTLAEAEKIGKKFRGSMLFKELEMIIVDEISMVRADLLDCVDAFLKAARKSKQSFGGIQMVFIGDLYQLPPVVTGEEKSVFRDHYKTPYFFDAKVMKELSRGSHAMEFVELEKIYRQHDEEFINLLNSIRNKTITDDQLLKLNQRFQEGGEPEEEHIYLTSTNAQADRINNESLEKLQWPLHRFEGVANGEFDRRHLPTDRDLILKKDARVMLVNNDSFGRWVNGTLGTVTKIEAEAVWVKIDNGNQEPVERVTWNLFHSYYDESSRTIEKKEIGRFTQFPLRLAWAVTIHKSQGKTFDRVVIDLGRGAFSHGQVYVALSRCRSLDGIMLRTPIKKGHILMDYQVIRFLTDFQYRLSEKRLPLEEKIE